MAAETIHECQCERAAHFPDAHASTPNGNPGHKYGARFVASYTVKIVTSYGVFRVCKDCAADCHG